MLSIFEIRVFCQFQRGIKLPWPFKKKKKKEEELPVPPSFIKKLDNILEEKQKTPPPLSGREKQVFKGRTRQQSEKNIETLMNFSSPPPLSGPPRKQPEKAITPPPNLPSPPPSPFANNVSSQPPISSQPPVSLFDDELASEIHSELRQRQKFGPIMKKPPERQAVQVSPEDLAKKHFRNSKHEYIEAGNKHLELNFYDNTATNYACAILCDLIAEGWQTARQTMVNLSSGVPSAVVENNFYDSVRLLLEAIKTKNFAFLTRAEKVLKKKNEHLYPEDVAMVEKAIKKARAHFGY